jgi:methyl-accepting chemotaxis protein
LIYSSCICSPFGGWRLGAFFMNNNNIENYLAQNQNKADKYMQVFVISFFVFGVAIAPIYNTWIFALGIGGLNMILFFGTFLLKNKYLGRMIVSAIFALYMLQFIGQMHGMAELHFFFFINIAILIVYQDWRLMIPYTIIAVGHHSVFFALQLTGTQGIGTYFINYTKVTYFTLVFHFGLAILMAIICGLWAYLFRNASYKMVILQQELNNQKDEIKDNIDFLLAISKGNFSKKINAKDEVSQALLHTKDILKEASAKEQGEKQRTKRLLDISEALRNHQNITSLGKSVVEVLLKSFDFVAMAIYYFQKNTEITKTSENQNLEKDTLNLIAQQGCTKEDVKNTIFVGEGLLGEVALTQQPKYFDFVQENSPILQSGLGKTQSPYTFIIPLCVNDNLVGIMSIASFKSISETERIFLQETSNSIARTFIAVETINQNEQLLKEAQNLTQELRSSEEELRQNLEEVNAIRDAMENVTFELSSQIQDKEQKIDVLEKQIKTLIEVKN